MKRIILIVAVTAIAWAGFAFFGKQTGSEAHAHEEHEHEEEVDFDHIPLTAKQVSTVDLKMGEAVEREMDATATEMETDVQLSALKKMSRIQTIAVRKAVKVVRA